MSDAIAPADFTLPRFIIELHPPQHSAPSVHPAGAASPVAYMLYRPRWGRDDALLVELGLVFGDELPATLNLLLDGVARLTRAVGGVTDLGAALVWRATHARSVPASPADVAAACAHCGHPDVLAAAASSLGPDRLERCRAAVWRAAASAIDRAHAEADASAIATTARRVHGDVASTIGKPGWHTSPRLRRMAADALIATTSTADLRAFFTGVLARRGDGFAGVAGCDDGLTENQRTIRDLHYRDGLTAAQIGRRLRLSPSAASATLRRIRSAYADGGAALSATAGGGVVLTPAMAKVMELYKQGFGPTRISEQLGVATCTVEQSLGKCRKRYAAAGVPFPRQPPVPWAARRATRPAKPRRAPLASARVLLRMGKRVFTVRMAQVHALAEQDMSAAAIASTLKISKPRARACRLAARRWLASGGTLPEGVLSAVTSIRGEGAGKTTS